MGRTMDIVDGKIVYDGRTLVEWVPDVVADLLGECDPLQVILFGSVARGDDGPDSDLDLLVVLPKVEQSEPHELMGRLRRVIKAVIPIDVIVTDSAEIERRRDVIWSTLYWPMRAGRLMHERPLVPKELWR